MSSHTCRQCGADGPFTRTQKSKGNNRRCIHCVGADEEAVSCPTCHREFMDMHSYSMHQKTHQDRIFPCPGCGKQYRGMTDTAIHFESGACVSCRGKDDARRAAYNLVQGQKVPNFSLPFRTRILSRAGENFLQLPWL